MTIRNARFYGPGSSVALICSLLFLVTFLSGCDGHKITKKRVRKGLSAANSMVDDIDAAQVRIANLASSNAISREDAQRLNGLLREAQLRTRNLVLRGQEILSMPKPDTRANRAEVSKLLAAELEALISVRDKGMTPINLEARMQLQPLYDHIAANARRMAIALGCVEYNDNCVICQPGNVIHCL
jgi:hypothetical protein